MRNKLKITLGLLGIALAITSAKIPSIVDYANSEPAFTKKLENQITYADSVLANTSQNFYYIDEPKGERWQYFKDEISGNKKVFIYYSADMCHSCYYMTPIVANMARKNKNIPVFMFKYKLFDNKGKVLSDSLDKYNLNELSAPILKVYDGKHKASKDIETTRLGLFKFWLNLKASEIKSFFNSNKH